MKFLSGFEKKKKEVDIGIGIRSSSLFLSSLFF